MKPRIRLVSVCSLLAFAAALPTKADTPSLALSADVSTTGVGASLWANASHQLVFTAGYGGLGLNHDYETEGVEYDGSAEFKNGHAIIRWYPSGRYFNLSTGAMFTENALSVTGRLLEGNVYQLDGVSYPASRVGSITGDVSWSKSLVSYFGLGWSKRPESRGWGAYLDLGVVQSGRPQARLSATGEIAEDPDFLEHLRAEEQQVNDELDAFNLFPVARFGVLYRF